MHFAEMVGRKLYPREPEWKRERYVKNLFKFIVTILLLIVVSILSIFLMLKLINRNPAEGTPSVVPAPIEPSN